MTERANRSTPHEPASREASRDRRVVPGADETYEAMRLAFELGCAVRTLREKRGWSQTHLAQAAGMTQSAVARFESGGSVPTLPVLERLARALDADLLVRFMPRSSVV
jgi:ribosome-binding protein aMBF1 (putative translation factor)